MLTRLRRSPLLAGVGEVLTDAVRYVAIMVALAVLLGCIARLLAGAP
jgi:hypothetical protein